MEQYKEILVNLGYKLKDVGDNWSCRPLYRESDNDTALSIQKKTGFWFDFVLNKGGKFEQLVALTSGQNVSIQLPEYRKYPDIELEHVKTFPKEYLLKLEKDHSYWNKRGISNPTLEPFRGGVAKSGRMAGRYCFPIFDQKDNVIGFSGRLLYKNDNIPKWKHLSAKKNFIFPLLGEEKIKKSKEVILVESIGNCLSLYENGIKNILVTFGTSISSNIISYLLKLDVNTIILGFDNDKLKNFAGNLAAEKARKQLLEYFDEDAIKIALPENKKDFGEMTPEEIEAWKIKNLS